MSGEVWYPVGPHDVFPETFGPFLLGNPAVREVFMKHHADLLDAAFWQSHKERILAGHVHDVFPYERDKRFAAQRPACAATQQAVTGSPLPAARSPAEREPNQRSTDYRARIAERNAAPSTHLTKELAMSDSIVIVGAARTPMGGFQGDFSSLSRARPRRRRDQGRGRARRHRRRRRRRGAVRQLPDGRPGPGAGAPGRAQGAACRSSAGAVTLSQDVRLGHEGGDVRARHAAGRHARRDGRRRHGEHDQRALPDAQGPRRLPHGPRHDVRPHDARRPGRRLRGAAARWAPSPRTAPPSTSSRARRRTRSRSPRQARARRPPRTAPSTGRSRRSR